MDGYTIGQVGKILQMPAQTLRFLEDRGLVSPQRNKHNDYRYYSLADIGHLVDYRWYRDAGYSLQESIDVIINKDLFQSIRQMQKTYDKAKAESMRQAYIAQRLESYISKMAMGNLAESINSYEITDSPAIHWCINAIATEDCMEYKPAEQLQEWFSVVLQYYCFITHILCVYADGFMDSRMEYGVTWGYGIEDEWAHKLDLTLPETTIFVPACKCLHTMLRIVAGESPARTIRQTIQPQLHDRGLQLCGDIWGNELVTVNEDGTDASYIELWVPIA